MKKIIFCILKVTEVGSRVGSGSVSKRYGSADLDPHQNVTDSLHWADLIFIEMCVQ
jgi:hypothetical protein